ncbi:glycosyltransferase [Bacillus salacetis]|uniref:Glycosyltransferase n=1 Tax=Bacillus salacetis TaxID=2315464 RepID=A0A3A1QZL5_9BACI|nr:glycosyltransferase [Bacillus salacetis]RIW31882.1 glycosyltransferase [Bacillus salacetis]
MNNKSINKRLQDLERLKKQLMDEILMEKNIVKSLSKEDSTWRGFLNPARISTSRFSTKDNLFLQQYLKEREKLANESFFEEVKPILDAIPKSNGSRFFGKLNINIGIIADEFLFNSFDGTANLFYLTRENYKQYKGKLDFLIVATTWRGLDNEWRGLGNPKSPVRRELFTLLEYFKEDVKVAFYSKEDPVSYERFLGIAQRCDVVFTTASEKVKEYEKDCKDTKAYLLPFGVNPHYHNPIGIRNDYKKEEVLFAGSWYNKYPHRQKDTRMIFEGVLESGKGLQILDRNYYLNNIDYFFPEEYLEYISPAISHAYVQKVHKLYNWAINLNSVTTSETMFANRVYELQALGNIIISNYSMAINNKFPNVFLTHSKEEVPYIINSFDDVGIYKHQVMGIRNVFTSETTYHRLNYILNCLGINSKEDKRSILVVVKKITAEIQEMFDIQSYPNKKLIEESELNDGLKSSYSMVSFFDDKYFYEEYYLQDLVNGFKYTDSDYISKDSYFEHGKMVEGIEYDYISLLKDKGRSAFWFESFTSGTLLELEENERLPNGFAIDSFEVSIPAQESTTKVIQRKDFKLSLIIPVYNNGKYLENKCFKSLQRSSIFSEMEIIIVDDGSTCDHTIRVVNRIERDFSNVKVYKFEDGGSGSASRPRNKGVELASAEYITYLDPDNEAVNDGYAYLLRETTIDPELDMVVGNILRLNDQSMRLNYYSPVIRVNGTEEIKDTRKVLIDTELKAQSIQALIVRKSVVRSNNLKMVEEAAGQDTLFFQELLLYSNKVKVINLDIHLYYAAVMNSVTNTVTKKFFDKYFNLEVERIRFLEAQDLLSHYMENRFNYYFVNWYLKRVPNLLEEDLEPGLERLYEILEIYTPYIVKKDQDIETFRKLVERKRYKDLQSLMKKKFPPKK